MKLNTQAVNFEMATRLEEHITKKTHRFEKLLPETAELDIRMTVIKRETNLNKQATIRVIGIGNEVFAEKTCDTFEQAVDEALEAIERQLEKQKDR